MVQCETSDLAEPPQTQLRSGPDDDVVMQRQAEVFAALLDLLGHAEIGLRRGRIARGVVVDQDQRTGVQHQGPLDHFTRVDRDVVHRADRHLLIRDDAVFAIKVEDMEPLDRSTNGQRAIITHRLPAADDRVLAEVTTEDVAAVRMVVSSCGVMAISLK